MRLLERACLQRWGPLLKTAAAHSSAHLRDGALRTAAVVQNDIARGRPFASVDASRAFDAVTHVAIHAALVDAGVPAEFTGFVMASLRQREYSVSGERLVPPAGRGTAQGTALGPYLFSITVERAVRAAMEAAPHARVISYLDNLYIAAESEEELAAAVEAATAQWATDGLARGDSFTANADVPGIARADGKARLLGVAIHASAEERFNRARKLARLAKQLSPLAELLVVRDCAAAQVVYDQRSGADVEELAELEHELVEQLRESAHIQPGQAGLVTLPASRRGLGLRPLAVTRDAAVLCAGIAALTGAGNILTEPFWEGVANPMGGFFRCFTGAAAAAGYVFDVGAREVRKGGHLVVRAPSSLPRGVSGGERRSGAGGWTGAHACGRAGQGGRRAALMLDRTEAAAHGGGVQGGRAAPHGRRGGKRHPGRRGARVPVVRERAASAGTPPLVQGPGAGAWTAARRAAGCRCGVDGGVGRAAREDGGGDGDPGLPPAPTWSWRGRGTASRASSLKPWTCAASRMAPTRCWKRARNSRGKSTSSTPSRRAS